MFPSKLSYPPRLPRFATSAIPQMWPFSTLVRWRLGQTWTRFGEDVVNAKFMVKMTQHVLLKS